MLARLLRALNPASWLTFLAKSWLGLGRDQHHQDFHYKANGVLQQPAGMSIQGSTVLMSTDVEGNSRGHTALQHRPHLGPVDDFSQERSKWISVAKQNLFSWDFSVFEFGLLTRGHPLITMTVSLLEHYELLDGWKLNRKTVENFLLNIEAEYRPNAYHNNIHASDVTQTSAIIMESFMQHVGPLTKMQKFGVLLASAVHDLGHLGVNNDFLINSRHPRATTYNDKSVNESYHISRAFEIARNNRGCDIFELFSFDEQKQCRKLMVDMVLATDMAIHFDLLKRFNAQSEEMPDLAAWPEPNLLLQMLLHLADIANPSRPFHLARGWAERVIQEFCEQGDKEAAGGLPLSPFCIRATMDMPRAQLNFIDVFLRPTLFAFEKAAPAFVGMALKSLEITIAEWKALAEQGLKM